MIPELLTAKHFPARWNIRDSCSGKTPKFRYTFEPAKLYEAKIFQDDAKELSNIDGCSHAQDLIEMMDAFFTDNSCPVCNDAARTKVVDFSYSTNLVLKKMGVSKPYPSVRIWQCQKCSHHYASPVISPEKLSEYYSQLNSIFYSRAEQRTDDPLEREHQITFEQVSSYMQPGRVLEIGCGQGFLLRRFADNGWEAHGVEPSRIASEFARDTLGLPVKSEFLTTEHYDRHSFDLIMLFDVVEHLTSMDGMMDLIKHYLKPNGMLVFGTGNINSINAKLNGKTWAYFGAWEHVSFFSPLSVEFLLDNHDFQLLNLSRHSHQGSTLSNIVSFMLNLIFFKPVNLVLPILFKAFPFLRKAKGISHRSMAETGVVTSRLAFDHFTSFARLK